MARGSTAEIPGKHSKKQSVVTDHRNLQDGPWWQRIPAWSGIDEETFHDHRWQLKNSVTRPEALERLVGDLCGPELTGDMQAGFDLAPMAMRLTPYVISLINWRDPARDPLRRQFLALGSEHEPDHPMGHLDALEEQRDAAAPGLTHRYPDKVLFLALDVCPVYCRYCTRSYSIGCDSGDVEKVGFRPNAGRWDEAFAYLEQTESVEDVVVSGGDLYLLSPRHIRTIGERLLQIPHIRRIRLATKGLAVMPQKVLTDHEWTDALTEMADSGRRRGVHVCLHTHFAHPAEITETSRRACDELFQRGITVRNQAVLLRGVNDDVQTMVCLVRKLSWINVQPYYIYIHDMVPGVEALRTSLADAVELEKQVRGQTAGFMTPTFVCDAVGGGGKRDLHSFELYDRRRGFAVYRSPVVDPDRAFFYFDPLRTLAPEMRQAWALPWVRRNFVDSAVRRAGL